MKNLPIISFFIKLYEKRKRKKEFKKKLEELKKRDPFVYKNF
jgi:preprotein translocase subunit YajC